MLKYNDGGLHVVIKYTFIIIKFKVQVCLCVCVLSWPLKPSPR